MNVTFIHFWFAGTLMSCDGHPAGPFIFQTFFFSKNLDTLGDQQVNDKTKITHLRFILRCTCSSVHPSVVTQRPLPVINDAFAHVALKRR